jgi:hypothetical protein
MAASRVVQPHDEGTFVQAPDGSKAVILGGYRRVLSDQDLRVLTAEGQPHHMINVDQAEFEAIPSAAAPLPDYIMGHWPPGCETRRKGTRSEL